MNPNRPTKSERRKQGKAAKLFLAKQPKCATSRLHSELYHSMTFKVRT